MTPERFTGEQLGRNLEQFVMLENDHGVNNWLLRGGTLHRGRPLVYVGAFPRLHGHIGEVITRAAEPGIEVTGYSQKVLELDVPDDADIIEDNRVVRLGMEAIVTRGGMPSIALVFGENLVTKEEVVALYAIVGISAETALKELQRDMRQAIAHQN